VAPIELPSIKELHIEVKSGVLAVRTLQRLGSSRQSVARSEVGGTAAGRREKILSEGREWRRRRGDGREIISARLLMQSPWVGENDEKERKSEKWDG
jgi:hypothetical protein